MLKSKSKARVCQYDFQIQIYFPFCLAQKQSNFVLQIKMILNEIFLYFPARKS